MIHIDETKPEGLALLKNLANNQEVTIVQLPVLNGKTYTLDEAFEKVEKKWQFFILFKVI